MFVKTTKEIAEYFGRTFKKGSDARLAIENLSLPMFTLRTDPINAADRTLNRVWEKEVDEYVNRMTHLSNNMRTVFSLVWGQCTDVMRQKSTHHKRRRTGPPKGHQGPGIQLPKPEVPATSAT
jgi:hypothetical protein